MASTTYKIWNIHNKYVVREKVMSKISSLQIELTVLNDTNEDLQKTNVDAHLRSIQIRTEV